LIFGNGLTAFAQNLFVEKDCFADVGHRFVTRLALTDTAWQARHFRHHITIFAGIQKNSSGHSEILLGKIIHRQYFPRLMSVTLVISLLLLRKFVWFVIRFAVELLNFFTKVRSVIAISI